MENKHFLEMVKQHAESLKTQEAQVDWAERLRWWLLQLSSLMTDVRRWLEPLEQARVVAISSADIDCNEQYLGRYKAPQLAVELGGQVLKLSPVASVIVGGFGRVDVVGPTGRSMLILVTTESDPTKKAARDNVQWTITSPKNRTALSPLDEKSFQQMFTDLFGIGG